MRQKGYLAMDFGGSSGRGVTGVFDGEQLKIQEIHRFPNYIVHLAGEDYWDLLYLYDQIRHAACKACSPEKSLETISVGIDTWGTDYGLLDAAGKFLYGGHCTRNSKGKGERELQKRFGSLELYRRTGSYSHKGGTFCQLYEQKISGNIFLAGADKMLMLPDLFAAFLTGEKGTEYTAAATTMMLDPVKRDWDRELLRAVGLPEKIFSEIFLPGTRIYQLLPELSRMWQIPSLGCVPVAGHDTASAVSAAPLRRGEAFCSSGTWSLLGIETEAPLITEKSFAGHFSNEGMLNGKSRLTRNCMGMWALQQSLRRWFPDHQKIPWNLVLAEAERTEPFRSLINLEQPVFGGTGDLNGMLRDYCIQTGQPKPETRGQTVRCILESMALGYRLVIDQLQDAVGQRITGLYIVGGGGKNDLLNQFAADALNRPVTVGPAEAACIGNLLTQAMAFGELDHMEQIRQVVRRSFGEKIYEPKNPEAWEEAYGRYQDLIKKEQILWQEKLW